MTAPTPEPVGQLAPLRQISRNIEAEVTRAGRSHRDIEAAIGVSHAYAERRKSGEYAWKLSEVDAIAAWLGIERDTLLPEGGLTVDLALLLTP